MKIIVIKNKNKILPINWIQYQKETKNVLIVCGITNH